MLQVRKEDFERLHPSSNTSECESHEPTEQQKSDREDNGHCHQLGGCLLRWRPQEDAGKNDYTKMAIVKYSRRQTILDAYDEIN